jgi:hypothetical protein
MMFPSVARDFPPSLLWHFKLEDFASRITDFIGIGEKGSVGVLLDCESDGGRISVLTSIGNGDVESRSCKVREILLWSNYATCLLSWKKVAQASLLY